MRRFKIFSMLTGEHLSDGVQLPNGAIAQQIAGQVFVTAPDASRLYLSGLSALAFRLEWVD